jgi:hypothetical protein
MFRRDPQREMQAIDLSGEGSRVGLDHDASKDDTKAEHNQDAFESLHISAAERYRHHFLDSDAKRRCSEIRVDEFVRS